MQDPAPDEHAALGTLTHRRAGGHVFACLVGEMDLSNADELRGRLLGLVDGTTVSLSIDLSRLAFIDSSGLAQLVRLRRALDAVDVPMDLLVAPGSVVDRTLTQFGARGLIPIAPLAGRELIPLQAPPVE